MAKPAEKPQAPETVSVEVVAIRRKGNEKFDVLAGRVAIPLEGLRFLERDVSMLVAIHRKKTEQARINLRRELDTL